MKKLMALVVFIGLLILGHGTAHAQCYTAGTAANATNDCTTSAWIHNFLGAVTTKCPSVSNQTATFTNGSAPGLGEP